jgi:adenylylsulfate kinase
MHANIPVLIVTGPVGVGKTTVAAALSELLQRAEIPHAVIDMDALRWCSPSPAYDPFHTALGLQNLAAVWPNYQAVGAGRLILVDIVESREDVGRYAEAVPGAGIVVVRLRAPVPTIWHRLEGREVGEGLVWHRRRAVELVTQMEDAQVEDLLVDTDGRTVVDIAQDVLLRTNWISRFEATG